MMRKLILSFVLGLFFIFPLVNAELFHFDYANLTGSSAELKKIDFGNSTALLDFASNVTSMGYEYICKYDNEPSLPSCFSGIATIPASNLEGNEIDIGSGSLTVNPTPQINYTIFYFTRPYCTGDSVQLQVFDETANNRHKIFCAAGSVNANYIVQRNEDDSAYEPTGIRIGGSTTEMFVKIDIQNAATILNNLTGYHRKVHGSDKVRAYMDYFAPSTTNENLKIDAFRMVNITPNFNNSANVIRFSRQRFDNANNSYEIFVYSKIPKENLNLVYSISCNNGTSWVNSSTSGGNNKTIMACPNGQLSHDFMLAIYHSDSISNWTGVYVNGGIASSNLPPQITFYNMTSEGGEGCTTWNTDKNTACTTSDTTPTVSVTTNENANCRIGIQNYNFTDLGIGKNCTGFGSTQHTCTLTPDDELSQEISNIYIGCQDIFGRENLTSTSGALKVSIQTSDLESIGRNAIESAILYTLISGYTIYTDQKLFARNSANSQFVGTFDKVIKKLNKIWAFNIITGNDSFVNVFNITPVMYALEIKNMSARNINSTIIKLVNNTK